MYKRQLLECVTSGVLRGAVAMVGCNNPKVRPDFAHIELMKKLLENDIILIVSGCSAQAAAKAGLMDQMCIRDSSHHRPCRSSDFCQYHYIICPIRPERYRQLPSDSRRQGCP